MKIRSIVRGIISVAGALSALTSLVMTEEGSAPKGYLDIAGVATACYGHTGTGLVVGKTYSNAQCISWLKSDVGKAYTAVDTYVHVPLTFGEHIAYADFIFNLGVGNFAHSTLLKKLNSGDHKGACSELLKWNKAMVQGTLVPVKGLTDRRQVEFEYCSEGM